MLFEIASEMRRGDEFPKATLCANASLLVLYLAAMAVGSRTVTTSRASARHVPDGPQDRHQLPAYFHVMITYALAFSRALRVFSASFSPARSRRLPSVTSSTTSRSPKKIFEALCAAAAAARRGGRSPAARTARSRARRRGKNATAAAARSATRLHRSAAARARGLGRDHARAAAVVVPHCESRAVVRRFQSVPLGFLVHLVFVSSLSSLADASSVVRRPSPACRRSWARCSARPSCSSTPCSSCCSLWAGL